MPDWTDEEPVTLSVVDRITLDHSGFRGRGGTVAQLKQFVFRDLTVLLNTKFRERDIPQDFEHSRNSLLAYGIPDFTHLSPDNVGEIRTLERAIRDAIRTFEPRLKDVTVEFQLPPKGEKNGPSALHYRVTALLLIKPEPEPIQFDTVLHPETKKIEVTEDAT